MVSTRMILLLFSMGNIVTAVNPSSKRKVIEISSSESDDIIVLDGEKSTTNTYIQGGEESEVWEKDPKKQKVDVSDNMAISEQQDSRKLQERLYRRIISSLTGLHNYDRDRPRTARSR